MFRSCIGSFEFQTDNYYRDHLRSYRRSDFLHPLGPLLSQPRVWIRRAHGRTPRFDPAQGVTDSYPHANCWCTWTHFLLAIYSCAVFITSCIVCVLCQYNYCAFRFVLIGHVSLFMSLCWWFRRRMWSCIVRARFAASLPPSFKAELVDGAGANLVGRICRQFRQTVAPLPMGLGSTLVQGKCWRLP